MITNEPLLPVREKAHNILAQGLQAVSPDELDELAHDLAALQLEQPVNLVKQIRQNLADRNCGQTDAEAFVKLLYTLSQADVYLSVADTVKRDRLQHLFTSVYVSETLAESAPTDVHAVLALPNPFARGFHLINYLKQASYDELVQSIEIIWFDSALSNFISEGLRTRAQESIALADMAFNRKNLVLKRTALKVLKRLGKEMAVQQEVLNLLNTWFQQTKLPLKYLIEETIAEIEGRHETYLSAKQAMYKYNEHNVQRVLSPKKGERYTGMYGLTSPHDPYYTRLISRVLSQEEDAKLAKTMLRGLVDIGGLDAIPEIGLLLGGPHTRPALETLSAFGDRSALTFIFNTLEPKGFSEAYRTIMLSYGSLVFFPLIVALKRLENPLAYKKTLASIFASIQSDTFVQELLKAVERDPEFGERMAALLQKLYPGQFKGAKTHATPQQTAADTITSTAASVLGGMTIKKTGILRMLVTPDRQNVVLHTNQEIDLLNMTTWQPTAVLKMVYPRVIAMSPDGEHLLTVRWIMEQRTYLIEVWAFGQWEQPISTIPHASEEVNALEWTSDGKYLLIGGQQTVRVVEFGAWRDVIELTGHGLRVTFMQNIPGRSVMLTGDWQGWLQVWETQTWNPVAKIKADSWAPKYAELSADGQFLVYAGFIGLKVWETATWRELISVSKPNNFDSMTLTPDAKYLVVSKNKKLRFLEFGSWKNAVTLENDSPAGSILITPDGTQMLTSGRGGVKVWNIGGLLEH